MDIGTATVLARVVFYAYLVFVAGLLGYCIKSYVKGRK